MARASTEKKSAVREAIRDKQRIVVKIGSSSLQHGQTGDLDYIRLEKLVRELCDIRNQGKDVILEIEIQGALKVKEKFPTALLMFVMPPGAAELKKRLEGRGTESPEVIQKRLKRATEEAEGIEQYDFIVINDKLEECVDEMHSLILAAHFTPNRNEEFINNMRKELEELI